MAKVAAAFSFNTDWKEKVLHVAPGFSQRPKNGANNEKKQAGCQIEKKASF